MADWEQIYAEKSVSDATAAEVLKDNTHLLPASGTALDYACGLAGNGQLLAQLGLAVTAWDYSRIAVEKINQYAAAQGLKLLAEAKDLEQDYPLLSGQFDVICVSCFLHRPSMTKLIDLLAPGGLLFYQTFSGVQRNSIGPSREAFRLRRGELLQTFSGMELLFYREDPQQLEPRSVYSDQVLFVAKKMKQPSANNNAGQSALLYDTRFSWQYLKPGYWPTWLVILLLWLVMWLPPFLQDVLANRLGDLARNINAKRRRIARKNLELCFPELTEAQRKQMLRASFRHQARSVLSYGLFWWAPRSVLQKRILLQGEAHINASLEKGRGVIFMAAHSFALEAAVSATTMRYPLSGPFNPMKNKLVDWFVAKGRTRHGTFIYPRSAGLRPIIKDARAGCTLFYLPDEDLGKDRCIFVPFFGVEKATVPVLGRLAKSCRADVLPTIACYDESRHRFVIHVLPALPDFPRGDDYADSLVMNQQLEKIIALCPEQYFWIMKLFKTRPPGQAKFY